MKFIGPLLFLLTISMALRSQSLNLVWADEFSGNSIDNAKWTHEIGTGSNGWGNNELQFYTARAQNSRIINDQLAIICSKENYAGRQYTSARMITKGKYSAQYGRIEARIKIPKQQGLWPAFWSLGNNFSTVGWPHCGEIDIMEHVNTNEKIHGTMHWDAGGYATYGGDTTLTDVSQYHVYSIEWDEFKIRWFVDGIKYHAADITNNINSTHEFHQDYFLILNMAMGGNWPGNPVANFVSDTLWVDYVRVYQKGFPASVNNTSTNSKFSIYPNPLLTGQSLNIEFESNAAKSITIFNILGVPVLQLDNLREKNKITLDQLCRGTYFIRIKNAKKTSVQKLILD